MKHSKSNPSPKNKYSATATVGIIIMALAVVLFISGAVMFFVSNKPASKNNPPKTPSSATAPSTATGAATGDSAPDSQPFTVPGISLPISEPTLPSFDKAPQILLNLLNEGGIDLEKLTQEEVQQLVVVKSSGSSAVIRFFDTDGGTWVDDKSLKCPGYVGAEGTAAPVDISENSEATSKGFYPIVSAFYQEQVPETGLDTVQMDSSSFIGLSDDTDDYSYGFIYDTDAQGTENGGSSQFFHIGNAPTKGDISTYGYKLLAYLSRLDAAKNPYILII